ncbi:hypothetical protein F5Y13DRAFT_205706 [Hypoxylon sp. FL1857]|nr:hypothetical protein F5Y13DRAFT_205706 [Hypoxylon sp. FL1857]
MRPPPSLASGGSSSSRRGSRVLQERDVNIGHDTQSIGSVQSTKSFISVGSFKSQGGRSQSVYGQSSGHAIYEWDDGWKSARYPETEQAHPFNHHIQRGFPDGAVVVPPFAGLVSKDKAYISTLNATVLAAECGNDQFIQFLTSSSLADPDPPPVPGRFLAFSTPMLASIGQENIKIIEILLKQEGFNPCRRFQGLTYYDIARIRRGSIWEDEVRILKQAYVDYGRRHRGSTLSRGGLQEKRLQLKTKFINQEPRGIRSPESFRTNLTSDSSTLPGSSPRRVSEISSACTSISRSDTDMLDSSTNEVSDDANSEEESISIQRAERRRTLLRNLMDIVYSTCTCSDGSGPLQDGESGSSHDSQGAGGSNDSNSVNNQPGKSHGRKGKRPLSRDDKENDQDEDEQGQQPKRIKLAVGDDGSHLGRKFACPYYQWNRHRRQATTNLRSTACYGPGFTSVHRMKEHLYRAHRLPLCCSRCDMTFNSDVSLEKHVRQNTPCELREKQPREGINSATEKLLRSRSKEFNSKTEEDKWRHVYTMIFPADNSRDLPSPYHENHAETNYSKDPPNPTSTASRFDEFLQGRLFQRIYEVLENRIDQALDPAERDIADTLKGQLQGIFHDVRADLYEEFQATLRTENERNPDDQGGNAAEIPIPELGLVLPDNWSLSTFPEPWSAVVLGDQPVASSSSLPQLEDEWDGITGSLGLDLGPLPSPPAMDNNRNLTEGPTASFKVKAVYDYASEHEDDLSFKANQIITVTDKVGADWYDGEYVDRSGIKKKGIFPRNLVERYRPPVPPRPRRKRTIPALAPPLFGS